MPQSPSIREYDVVVVGAGPAGATCALALHGSGLRVAVLDKASFPRDKVCGDALPGSVARVLHAIDPQLADDLDGCASTQNIRGIRLIAPDLRHCDLAYSDRGYTCKRAEFDHFLLEKARARTDADFFLDTPISSVAVSEAYAEVICERKSLAWRAPLVIGCDGAQSVVARCLTETRVDRNHYCGAVRAYYENVADTPGDLFEVYLPEAYLPGYFWIFPLPGKVVNVGFGMLSQTISARSLSLKKTLDDIIATTPALAERFRQARRLGPVKGFGLPLGSRCVQTSGDRFMLTGDAASLIDPTTGEGVGHAMVSGKLAAEQAVRCFQEDLFTAAALQPYDDRLDALLGASLRRKYFWQRLIIERAWLLNYILAKAGRDGFVKRLVHKTL